MTHQKWDPVLHPIWRLEADANSIVDHGLRKAYSYFLRVNSSYYEAISGSDGTLDYGGPNDAGGIDGTDAKDVITAAAATLDPVHLHFKAGDTFPISDELAIPSDTLMMGYHATLQGSVSHLGGKMVNIADGKGLIAYGITFDVNNLYGVGVGADLNNTPTEIKLVDCDILNVYSYGISNGCVQGAVSTSPLTLLNCDFTAHSSDSVHELILTRPVNRVTINNCTFQGNKWFYLCGREVNVLNSEFTAVGFTGASQNPILGQQIKFHNNKVDSAFVTFRPLGDVHYDNALATADMVSVRDLTHKVTQDNCATLFIEGYDATYGFKNVIIDGVTSERGSIQSGVYTGQTHSFIDNLAIRNVQIGTHDANVCIFVLENMDCNNLLIDSCESPAYTVTNAPLRINATDSNIAVGLAELRGIYPDIVKIVKVNDDGVNNRTISINFKEPLDGEVGTTVLGTAVLTIKFYRNADATTNVNDGGTIAHGCVGTPDYAQATGTVAGEMVTITGIDATNLTIGIKTHAGAAGTQQTIYWEAQEIR